MLAEKGRIEVTIVLRIKPEVLPVSNETSFRSSEYCVQNGIGFFRKHWRMAREYCYHIGGGIFQIGV